MQLVRGVCRVAEVAGTVTGGDVYADVAHAVHGVYGGFDRLSAAV